MGTGTVANQIDSLTCKCLYWFFATRRYDDAGASPDRAHPNSEKRLGKLGISGRCGSANGTPGEFWPGIVASRFSLMRLRHLESGEFWPSGITSRFALLLCSHYPAVGPGRDRKKVRRLPCSAAYSRTSERARINGLRQTSDRSHRVSEKLKSKLPAHV